MASLGRGLVLLTELLLVAYVSSSSLTFVIDDTYSMNQEIDQVKRSSNAIVDVVLTHKSSQIENFILVTFNDPSVARPVITNDKRELKRALEAIYVHGGGDCPEKSLSGISVALQTGLSKSYLYVFTDADALDYDKYDEVVNLCQEKQSQVVFVLTGICYSYKSESFKVYNQIAKACSGKVYLTDKKSVEKIIPAIKETIKGDNSDVKKITVDRGIQEIYFDVDDKTDSVLISASASKFNTHVDLTVTGPYRNQEQTTWLDTVKVIKLNSPSPGKYLVTIDSSSMVDIHITARTDFTFEHGFSKLQPNTINDTTVKPIGGIETHLSVKVKDPEHEIEIKNFEILGMHDEVIRTLSPIRPIGTDFYMSVPFLVPTEMFQVAVTGTVKKTGSSIRRIATTPVQPQKKPIVIDPKKPTIVINEGNKKSVPYGESVSLTCKVDAYPQPNIVWTDNLGKEIATESSLLKHPYSYISYLRLSNVIRGQKYTCRASNSIGRDEQHIEVSVMSPFTVHEHMAPTTNAKYDKEETLKCKIRSNLNMKINWAYNGRPINSPNHILSNDGTELKIKSVDQFVAGKYTCTAILVGDPAMAVSYSTEVKITDLEAPVFQKHPKRIETLIMPDIIVPCRLLKGNPKPLIRWYVMNKSSKTFELLKTSTDQELHVKNPKLSDSGIYRCIANNFVGEDEVNVELVIEAPPKIVTGNENKRYEAVAGNSLRIPCKVEANPPASISWTANGKLLTPGTKYEITNDAIIIRHLTKEDTGKYNCKATNKLGTVTETFEVLISYAPNIVLKDGKKEYKGRLGEVSLFVPCKVDAYPEAQIIWTAEGKVLNTGHKYEVGKDGLVIKDLKKTDEMQYKCEAINKVGKASETFDVKVLYPPRIILEDNKKVYTGFKGDVTLRIPCKVEANPVAKVTWTVNGISIPIGSKYLIESDTLVVTNPSLEDNGKYQCKAQNEIGTATETFTGIVTSNIIQNPKENIFIARGKTLKIVCSIPTTKLDSIRWFKDLEELKETGKTLVIENISENQTGKYTCRVSNHQHSESETYPVHVGYPPSFVTEHPDKIDWRGKGSIDCTVNANPAPMIKWYRDGKLLDYASNTSQLHITDWGNYNCHVENRHGVVEKTTTVFSSNCLLNTKTESELTPFILFDNERAEQYENNNDYLVIPNGEKITLSCFSKNKPANEFLKFPGRSDVKAVCDHESKYIIDGSTLHDFSELICKENILPDVLETNETCHFENSKIITVGYYVENDFVPLYDSCFDTAKQQSIYTFMEISDTDIVSSNGKHKWFKYPGIGEKRLEIDYTCKDDSSTCCFTKGQIVDKKFAGLGPKRTGTYIEYLNSVPYYRSCDSRKTTWENVTEAIAKEIKVYRELDVWSGASGFEKDIPRYLWKVINFEGISKAVIYVNTPSPTEKDILCENTCGVGQKDSWFTSNNAYIYCCDSESFIKGFKLPPRIFDGRYIDT